MSYKNPIFLAFIATSLAACGGGSGGSSASAQGQFTAALTDAPVTSAHAVSVAFTAITLKRSNGDDLQYELTSTTSGCAVVDPGSNTTQTPCVLDLTKLTGGTSVVLINQPIPAGDYTQIRLGVETGNDTYVDLDDGRHLLTIPSGDQTGLKLIHNFTVSASNAIAYTIDFDVRKSLVHQGNGQYKLKPTLRIVETAAAGQIQGTVDETTLVAPLCAPNDYINGFAGTVYVYAGHNVTPDDIGGSGNQPLTTAPAVYDSATGKFNFTAAFLPAGDYSLAYSCDGDDPEADESLIFSATTETTLAAGETQTLNLSQ